MDKNTINKALQRRLDELERENKRLKSDFEKEVYELFLKSLDMLCVADINSTTLLKVNPAFTKTLGFSEKELLGRPFTDFIHPDDLESAHGVIEKKLKTGTKVLNFEIRCRCKDGSYRWLSWVSHPVPEKGLTYAIARDITDRKTVEIDQKKTQQELIQRNQFIETILDNFPIGLGVNYIDNGTVTYLNKKWEEIYGWPKEAFPTVDDFFEKVFPDPAIRKTVKERIIKDIQSGDPNRMAWDDLEITTANGEKRIVFAKNIPLMHQNLMISTVQDITEKRKLEVQVQQSQKIEAVGTLAGGIAHDFNNLLSIITGNISYALSLCRDNTELREILADVQEGAKQSQKLTYQLLTFAKGGKPIKQTCDVNNLLRESAVFVTRGAKSKCEFKLDRDLLNVEVDAGQINQVVGNLVINADHAMPNGGIITIEAENVRIENAKDLQLPDGKYVRIAVKDQGIGIPKQHLSNIFDPYFTTKQKGSGLGLATAYSIVKKHGGHLTVDSEMGKGSVFNIYLPASAKEILKCEDKDKKTHQGRGAILIMDDNEAILKMAARVLNRMGYETSTATDGATTLAMYRNAYDAGNPFDLVILDLTVPGGMGGAETITALLKIDPKVTAVVSSGYSNDPIMANYQDYGFCGVVPKPYTREHLSKLFNHIFKKTE